jgi:transglutaminase-like putative cysteine protease
VNGLLEKKPTVSLPSALEVLRTKVGDCNEHTALYVAMARSLGIPSALEVLRTKVGDCNEHTALYVAMARAAGIPARVAVGLVYVHGAFYYHAWPEVFVDDAWLAVDPTLNEFPADATHLRLLRGGLDKQAAILPLIGKLKISVVDVELAPQAERILVGSNNPPDSAGRSDLASLAAVAGARTAKTCWCGWFGGAK